MFQILEISNVSTTIPFSSFRFLGVPREDAEKTQLQSGSPQKLTIPKAVEKYVHDYHGATPHRAPPAAIRKGGWY